MKNHPASTVAAIVAANGLRSASTPPTSEITPKSASQIQDDRSL
jgi:hypothetical protein